MSNLTVYVETTVIGHIAVGAAFHLLVPVIAPAIPPQFEAHPALYRPWHGWTSTYMVIHPFVYGVVFAALFLGLRQWSAFPRGVRGVAVPASDNPS